MIVGLITAFVLIIVSTLLVYAISESIIHDTPKIVYCTFFGGVCITVGLYLLVTYL